MKTILTSAVILTAAGALLGFAFVWIVDILRPGYDHTSNWGISLVFASGGAVIGPFFGLTTGAIIVVIQRSNGD